MAESHATSFGARVGGPAPPFQMPVVMRDGHETGVTQLSDYRGRWLVLLFYPRDFSLVCPTELTAFSTRYGEFQQRDTDVLGVSVDNLDAHRYWLATPRSEGGLSGLRFPLASDASGDVSRSYGVLLPDQGVATRGLFVIDPDGVLQYLVVHNLAVGRNSDEILRVLDALRSGGLCAENWSLQGARIDPASALGAGRVVAHYRVERKLGTGSFGAVFEALDLQLERRVAIKVLNTTHEDLLSKVLTEARSTAPLSHPNICTVFSVDNSEGVPIIAMELVDGPTLAERLKSGPLPVVEAADVAWQIASGLAAAHRGGVVHGDLKPANIMLAADGTAKILDFGLARRRGEFAAIGSGPLGIPDAVSASTLEASATIELPAQAFAAGTPSYMAPEQTEGLPATEDSDVFSFGALMYELVTGRRTFVAENVIELFEQIRRVNHTSFLPDVPTPLHPVLAATLQRDPADRESMAAIGDLLASSIQQLK